MQFNYSALDSYEFELLSRDVAEKLMHIKLSCYTEGRDGGIDASDFISVVLMPVHRLSFKPSIGLSMCVIPGLNQLY